MLETLSGLSPRTGYEYSPSDRRRTPGRIPESRAHANQWRAPCCVGLVCLQLKQSACSCRATTGARELTRALRLGREDGSIGGLGGDGSVAGGRRHRAVGGGSQGGEGGRVDIEALLRVLVLVEFGVVVDIGTGWARVTKASGRRGGRHLLFS